MSTTEKEWPDFTAGQTDDRGINWRRDLNEGETIAEYDFVPNSDDLTLDDKRAGDPDTITIGRFSGGIRDTVVEIECTAVTSQGRTLIVRQTMRIT